MCFICWLVGEFGWFNNNFSCSKMLALVERGVSTYCVVGVVNYVHFFGLRLQIMFAFLPILFSSPFIVGGRLFGFQLGAPFLIGMPLVFF